MSGARQGQRRAETYRTVADLPGLVPIFPLAGALLLPRGRLPLNIFEPRYLAMVNDALAGERTIAMVQPSPCPATGGPAPDLYRVGCLGRITQFSETGDGRYLITLTGICRFRIGDEPEAATPYRQVIPEYGDFVRDLAEDSGDILDRPRFLKALNAYLVANKLDADWGSIEGAPAESLVNTLAMLLPFEPQEKQALLQAPGLTERADALLALLELAAAGQAGGMN
ncbi:MAG: LON peptidase substrate-binding domain-containing protein [Alphaproteobacteria bacterium]|nr:LON peptidase substrate-binding domain-containing protein [Alphaproteobacteria bacterium]MDX5368610.1 LON peptidase substrate-binding domain-containing protein [Alphaproteobacteria bacterium]MDX5463355.1 LON peptidase substrate-binding domain-containing protein [Alphaproteobacteria bacterium]